MVGEGLSEQASCPLVLAAPAASPCHAYTLAVGQRQGLRYSGNECKARSFYIVWHNRVAGPTTITDGAASSTPHHWTLQLAWSLPQVITLYQCLVCPQGPYRHHAQRACGANSPAGERPSDIREQLAWGCGAVVSTAATSQQPCRGRMLATPNASARRFTVLWQASRNPHYMLRGSGVTGASYGKPLVPLPASFVPPGRIGVPHQQPRAQMAMHLQGEELSGVQSAG